MEKFISYLESHLLQCTIKSLTGFDCPGCGMQRAFIALLRGDIGESIHFNPALLPLLVTIFFAGLHIFFNYKNGARFIVFSFYVTVSLMIVNFVVKSLHHL